MSEEQPRYPVHDRELCADVIRDCKCPCAMCMAAKVTIGMREPAAPAAAVEAEA